MKNAEKLLYHQIHPLKLAVDWLTGIAALVLLWRHELAAAVTIAILPPIFASLAIIKYADLESLKVSAFGRYVRRYMTPAAQTLRLVGFIVMGIGAWRHGWKELIVGLAGIVVAWTYGLIPRIFGFRD